MNKWWALYAKQTWDRRVVGVAVALVAVSLLTSVLRPQPVPRADGPLNVDTFIPRGFVLVPIEADNYEALDSILGPFGWVDLFRGGADGGERRLVARNIRLVRAPNNPSHFAVLVPEARAPDIVKSGANFTVILKRPGQNGTVFEDRPTGAAKPAPRRITYGEI